LDLKISIPFQRVSLIAEVYQTQLRLSRGRSFSGEECRVRSLVEVYQTTNPKFPFGQTPIRII
jgi:hypothetical protein